MSDLYKNYDENNYYIIECKLYNNLWSEMMDIIVFFSFVKGKFIVIYGG